MPPRKYTLDEIVRIIARRRWVILVPFAIGLAAAPLLEPLTPERYRSETMIIVVPQRVPDSYVKPTITESVGDRLPTISDQILSRSRLERIIQDMDLYLEERSRLVMEDVVERMRADVTVTLDDTGDEADSFHVSYVSDHPETAQKVTERLASLYIEQNLRDRESQAESTSQFLETQLEEARRRLIEQEKKLEEYRRRHAGELPTQLQANLQAIQNANVLLQSLNESINRAQERRLFLERQIADTKALPRMAAASETREVPATATTAQQLEAAQAQLTAYLQRYTPEHPEVVGLQRAIRELMTRAENETPIGTSRPPSERSLSPAEAAQRRRILELQAELEVIDHQLAANRTEDQRLRRMIGEYQAKVDVAPTRESELVELTRDYSTIQAAYTSLLMKREDSAIAANLERRQIGEQFRIVDPASLPQRPYNGVRRLIVTASGCVLGLVFGLLLAGALEYRDSSFRSEEEVFQMLSLPVLAKIPAMSSDREQRSVRRRMWAIDVSGIILVSAAAVALILWRLSN